MAYEVVKEEKGNKAIVWSQFQLGVAPGPLKGIANIRNANLSTEEGEVMASFGRTQQSITNSTGQGTISYVASAFVSMNLSPTNNKFKGMWITVSNSSNTGQLNNGNYWVTLSLTTNLYQFATTYGGDAIATFGPGLTANFTLIRNVGRAVAQATETYFNAGVEYHRYYILDHQGLVWMYDTINDVFPSDDQQYWVLPDPSITYFGSDAAPSGIGVLNGWLFVFSGNKIWCKPTVNLGGSYVQMTNATLSSTSSSANPHFALTSHQGSLYFTDGPYVGSIFPNSSLLTGVANVQSYASYTAVTTTCSFATLWSGTTPTTGANVGLAGFSRIPVVFYTNGTLPSSVTANTVYYIQYSTANQNFEVYDALTGGSAKNMQTGAVGTQWYNTFYPLGTHAAAYGDTATMEWTPQFLGLPSFEVATCMAEVGNLVLVGTKSSVLYPWNQVDSTPAGIINLPEANTRSLLTVNQMAYIFAGNKGNIYITDGSTASLVLKLPDYCAGIDGTPSSYFEPNFTWGGTAYVRGRVYFSVLDQTLSPSKAGNCGGVWSFYPTQNLAYGQETGLALRLENQNSYGTYNGYATILIPFFDQGAAKSPQYWSAWQSGLSSITYGFDKTATTPVGTVVIDLDLTPVGTVLNKYTPKQIEYKLSTAMTAGESVGIAWRKNSTDAFVSAGNPIFPDGATGMAGYFTANFQGAQWVQLRITLTPITSSTASGVRLTQIIMR